MLLLTCLGALAALPTEAELFRSVLSHLDRDGDGSVSRAEYVSFDDAETFARIDVDGDRVATENELGDWVRVQQPRPVERSRPDTPGFARMAAPAPSAPSGCTQAPIGVAAPFAALLLLWRRR